MTAKVKAKTTTDRRLGVILIAAIACAGCAEKVPPPQWPDPVPPTLARPLDGDAHDAESEASPSMEDSATEADDSAAPQ